MNRRELLRGTVATGAMGAMAGCGQLDALLGGGCGPGTVEIAGLPERVTGDDAWTAEQLPRVEGTVESVADGTVVVADGTGRARLEPLGSDGFEGRSFAEGDCVSARIIAAVDAESDDVDVRLSVDELGEA